MKHRWDPFTVDSENKKIPVNSSKVLYYKVLYLQEH